MRYAIIGTGAIGGYYGGLLAKAGREVHFLLRSDYEYVCENGLKVESCDGDYHLEKVNAYRDTNDMPACDVVIVALKTICNRRLPEMLKPILRPDSIILLIQNGIGVEADLQQAMPEAQIAGGAAFICTLKHQPGVISHMANGKIHIGNFSCRDQQRLEEMVGDFVGCGIKAKLMEYHEMRWKKAVWNMPFNGMTAAVGAPSAAHLLLNDGMASLIRKLMEEVISGARACGVEISDDFIERMFDLTRKMPAFASSMKFDYDHHHRLELYYIYQRPIDEARRHGCEMPLLSMLAAQLQYMDEKNVVEG